MRTRQIARANDRGFALIAALLVTIVIGIMAVAMMRSFTVIEKKSANVADKQRAFAAAQSALTFGEWWLTQGNGSQTAVACNTMIDADPAKGAKAGGQICSNALASPIVVPLTAGMNFKPASLTVASTGGLDASGNANYANAPQFYIRSDGFAADGRQLFEVTGIGYGGSGQTVAITQSTFALTRGSKSIGGL